MGQIDDIMAEIENTNTRQSVLNSHIAEKIVRWVLQKHLEPQKKYPKLRCKECWSSYEYIIQDWRAPICWNCKWQKLEEID